jgi:SAM-dependent methyltransferase
MPASYDPLAPVYDEVGMSQFAANITPRLLDYSQQTDWLGRQIMDLGCGTGVSLAWLAERGYVVAGIDHSAAMLQQTRARLDAGNLSADLFEADIRQPLTHFVEMDMVLALNILNELGSLREIGEVFAHAHTLLAPEKRFIFDLFTIQGLTEHGQHGDTLTHQSDDLVIFTTNRYDYERQINHKDHTIFRLEDGGHWSRSAATQTLRTFPAQAIAALLQRNGFHNIRVLDLAFRTYEPGVSNAQRVIFIAEKQ